MTIFLTTLSVIYIVVFFIGLFVMGSTHAKMSPVEQYYARYNIGIPLVLFLISVSYLISKVFS